MKMLLLFSSMLMGLSLFAQVGSGVPGTVNQIDKDPAVEGFQNSYDDLKQEVDDLDEREKQEEEDLPTDAVEKTQEDTTPNFIEENEI